MAGLDENGLTIKRLPDIISELESALKLQYGNDVDLTENSLLGILNTIYAASVAENWELAQALYNAFNIDTATGKQLDDLVSLLNITRLLPTKSFGELQLFGNSGSVIPSGTQFSDTLGNVYESTSEVSLDTGTSRTPINIYATGGIGTTGELSTTYQIIINGDVYSKQFLWADSASYEQISLDMTALIGDRENYKAESVFEGNADFVSDPNTFSNPSQGDTRLANTSINIINKDETNPIVVSATLVLPSNSNHYLSSIPYISVRDKVSTFSNSTNVESVLTGEVSTNKNTLNNIVTPVTGLSSVNNSEDMTSGRDLESDEELRLRFKTSGGLNSFATAQSTQSKLRQLDGVTEATVTSNRTSVTDSNGIPPHSYECMVVGGTEENIARAIWEDQPSGIDTFGSISKSILDDQGIARIVRFSRPEKVYVWVKVEYSLYSEEVFPDQGNQAIELNVLEYGTSLGLGEDVIPKRFYGTVYSVGGIGDVTIKVATSVDSLTEPPLVDFQEISIPISNSQESNFSASRTEAIKV